ncbi:DPY30/SDC1 family protein [Aspergillus saccharolyticus JOP 1030-1]|uniref:COMPASS complex subunit Sdc1 n=1 Tax=Aspergillus saccharolyticus JOP 1030-1 TaxID=1450539 RepID=A0A318ZWW7_9EURO|nr:hypothetical protein BP01DRAFT_113677 [Aspergillus saccharolyticus JOP 1030-1]PYH48813.1 hypothetical protein BP01DRAFT_113677 [Aspergillus saccharolyticus JOP 1030-1]
MMTDSNPFPATGSATNAHADDSTAAAAAAEPTLQPPQEQQQHHENPQSPTPLPTTTTATAMAPDSTSANTPTADSAAATPTTAAAPAPANSSPVRPGGAPARVYMNEKIVPYLLEGMKSIVKEQPSNPLRVLGEYLIQKSNELEQGSASAAATKTPE